MDEPDGDTYRAKEGMTSEQKEKAVWFEDIAPLAKLVNESGYNAYTNLHPYVYPTDRKQGLYEYTTYLEFKFIIDEIFNLKLIGRKSLFDNLKNSFDKNY